MNLTARINRKDLISLDYADLHVSSVNLRMLKSVQPDQISHSEVFVIEEVLVDIGDIEDNAYAQTSLAVL